MKMEWNKVEYAKCLCTVCAHRCQIYSHTHSLPTVKVSVHSKRQLECERDFNSLFFSLFLRDQRRKKSLCILLGFSRYAAREI